MATPRWLKGIQQALHSRGGRTVSRRQDSGQRPIQLRFEPLEERTVPSTLTVDNLNDSGPGSLRAAIAAANLGDNDVIVFAKGLTGTISLESGELLISQGMTIDGPSAGTVAISGGSASRIFEIEAGLNVAIRDLTIEDGEAVYEGGGILNDGSNLTLYGDRLLDNQVYESSFDALPGATDLNAEGGGLYSVAGNVTLTDCQITGNVALGASGSSAYGNAYNAGLDFVAGKVAIAGCTITGNEALAADNSLTGESGAGGIFSGAPITISNSTFSDNLAAGGNNTAPSDSYGGGGGAVASGALEFTAPATITSCTFNSNQAVGGSNGTGVFVGEAEGGAIYDGSSATIKGCTFDGNAAFAGNGGNSGTGTSSQPSGVEPGVDNAYGGAICTLFDGSLTIASSTFKDNQAVGGNDGTATGTDIVEVGDAEGGAICAEIGCTDTISSCTLSDNQAWGGSGNTANGPVVNVGAALGGAIDSSYGGDGLNGDLAPNITTVTSCTLQANDAVGGSNNSGTASVSGLVGAGFGAGIANYLGATTTAKGSLFALGYAGGGTGNTGNTSDSEMVFTGVGAGGAIANFLADYTSAPLSTEGYGPLTGSIVTLSHCSIEQNVALGGIGGGLFNPTSSVANVLDSSFVANQAVGVFDDAYPGYSLGGGGGIENEGSLTVVGGSFTNNLAVGGNDAGANGISEGSGGGIDSGDLVPTGTLSITGTTFTRNVAEGGGNAYESLGGGGGATAASPLDSISDSTFQDNQALGGPVSNGLTIVSQGLGGGINNYDWSEAFTFSVSDSKFIDNKAIGGAGGTSLPSGPTSFSGYAGGLLSYYGAPGGSITVTGTEFTGNEAIGGAGGAGGTGSIALGGGMEVSQEENLTLSTSTFSDNAAIGGAGGLGAGGGDGFAGGLSVDTSSTATITDTTFESNRALGGAAGSGGTRGNGWGGGLSVGTATYLDMTDSSSVLLSDSVISHNSASGEDGTGGGILLASNSSLNVNSSQVTHNSANGLEDGQGTGGGIDYLGAFTTELSTIDDNTASTSNNNIGT